ncbi:MAG: hypothetical protein JKY94_17380 [Rhodobacteraceae bacterium]|nr:hypothetical protein [Paracoccaceae bacterium]
MNKYDQTLAGVGIGLAVIALLVFAYLVGCNEEVRNEEVLDMPATEGVIPFLVGQDFQTVRSKGYEILQVFPPHGTYGTLLLHVRKVTK